MRGGEEQVMVADKKKIKKGEYDVSLLEAFRGRCYPSMLALSPHSSGDDVMMKRSTERNQERISEEISLSSELSEKKIRFPV